MTKKALAFSGGKDSLACWLLFRDEDPYVIWVNTGKAYPETLALVELVRSQTSKFVEVRTDQDAQNAAHGLPSEIVPIDWTVDGMKITGEKPTKIQSYLQCCWTNISLPLHSAAKELGAEFLIRGQRTDEHHKSPVRDGMVVDGITYLQPIENWTRADVLDFIARHMDVPEHFSLEHSSMDCYDCTAFLGQSRDRAEWTRIRWPELHMKYRRRLEAVATAISPSLGHLTSILES
ncbi:phosphoadenosine phosphosulfate reductase family protein [Burkholderia cenocepacia]|uniref:phosphoadenosine phosphosulfate reductase domain-containing protein n=1 Tax=Burkholderia cenocepacia TaxID=95486 RepID=UPI001F27F225|nr:phosphoadenosine phosphosulfate reductase family protein [Burkholderia cenocepacia]MCF1367307.1 phosphoadenosine phosphosulfate reductase family protein [Burkholderia cenocepacia]MCF1384840.1 phosphoadenosine phosphosulfate reductase family protein [Burkholderia cenocepacia]